MITVDDIKKKLAEMMEYYGESDDERAWQPLSDLED